MKKSILLLPLVYGALANPALASNADAGTVKSLTPTSAGTYFFSQTGSRTAAPACSTQNRWVINSANSAGQAQIATLLTAYSSGKKIVIVGSGDCGVWPDTESVAYFYTVDP